MALEFTNNASATLAADINNSTTSIALTTGDGALFASPTGGDYQVVTLENTNTGDIEIVHVTARSGDTLTVTRAQEGTSGTAFAAADTIVESRVTAGILDELNTIGDVIVGSGTSAFKVGDATTHAYGDYSVAVGYQAESNATYNDGIAIGRLSQVDATSGIAIGYIADIDTGANYGVAVGEAAYAGGQKAIAIGYNAKANAPNSISLSWGANTPANADSTIVIGAWPAIQREDWFFTNGETGLFFKGHSTIVSTPPVDLGPGVAWAATTAYDDQDVVIPTTPNTKQYYLTVQPYDTSNGADNNITSNGSEPTWPTSAQGDSVTDGAGAGEWVMIDPLTGITIDCTKGRDGNTPRIKFIPTRAGFICYEYASITAAPYISVGNGSSATAYVNNQQLTSITQTGQVQWIDISNAVWCDDVVFTLETAGTGSGGIFRGRFLVEGFHVQTQD